MKGPGRQKLDQDKKKKDKQVHGVLAKPVTLCPSQARKQPSTESKGSPSTTLGGRAPTPLVDRGDRSDSVKPAFQQKIYWGPNESSWVV